MNYEEKISDAKQKIERLQGEIGTLSGMARQITEVENGREIDRLNKKIAEWTARANETAEKTAAREEAARKEAARLEWLNNNFDELDENDWE
jgi:hypothetical protein